jgi:hypothetical protein
MAPDTAAKETWLYPHRCGMPTPPEQKRATLFCQREKDHDGLPHQVYGGDGKPIREWV